MRIRHLHFFVVVYAVIVMVGAFEKLAGQVVGYEAAKLCLIWPLKWLDQLCIVLGMDVIDRAVLKANNGMPTVRRLQRSTQYSRVLPLKRIDHLKAVMLI